MNKFIKTYGAKVKNTFTKSSLYSLYSLFTETQIPPKAYMNTKFIQTYRIDKARKLIIKRRKRKKAENVVDLNLISKELNELEDQGIVVVNNFLPENCIDEITKYRKTLIDSDLNGLKHFELRGAEYLDGMIEELLPKTFKFINENQLIDILPKIYLGRSKVSSSWRLKFIRDLPNQMDQNCINHSDTFHNTLKIWIYIDDVEANQDSLKYWKKSHLPNHSIDEYRLKSMLDGVGSPRLEEGIMEDHGYKKFDESIKSNTLIIADTFGFHYRNFAPSKTDWRPTIFCSLRHTPFF